MKTLLTKPILQVVHKDLIGVFLPIFFGFHERLIALPWPALVPLKCEIVLAHQKSQVMKDLLRHFQISMHFVSHHHKNLGFCGPTDLSHKFFYCGPNCL